MPDKSHLPQMNGKPVKWTVQCPECLQPTPLFLVIRNNEKAFACQKCDRILSQAVADRGYFEPASESDRTLDYLFLNNPVVNRAMQQAATKGKSWREAIVAALAALAQMNEIFIHPQRRTAEEP